MQAVKITTESETFVGTPTIVRNIFSLPEDTKIFWAGSRIYAKRLCGKDIGGIYKRENYPNQQSRSSYCKRKKLNLPGSIGD